jgi:polyisoprenoid-binding protein YceI
MTSIQTEAPAARRIPSGEWELDPVHSRIGFAVRHLGVSWFRGGFADVKGRLDADGLSGTAEVESVAIDEPGLKAHLLTPEFFDAARHPRLRFHSHSIETDGDLVSMRGELTIKGTTAPIDLTGTVLGPVENAYGAAVLALELTGTLDRRDFGLEWQAPLPGGGLTVGNEVTLTAQLELVRAEA